MRRIETAEIVAVGSELLTPHRIDTNSLHLTEVLNAAGIDVHGKGIVGDDRGELRERLRQALERADLVVTTGGLGPTDDDVTREAVAAELGRELVEDAEVLSRIEARFAQRRRPMPALNRRQALVPAGAQILPNPFGTAPGLLLETPDGRLVCCLPGPAREVRPMVADHLLPRLAGRTTGEARRRRVVMVTGRAESEVEEAIRSLDPDLAAGEVPVTRGTFATPGLIEVHLLAAGDDRARVDAALARAAERVAGQLGAAAFSTAGRTLEEVVGQALLDRGWRIAAAESCTGGLLLGRLTDVPGSSAYVIGGVVAYANAVKARALGVPAELIERHGAVSEPVGAAMARGVRDALGADIGVAITGIAGPGGGSPEKPVGTVVIAVDGVRSRARTFGFGGDRAMVRALSVAAALDMVRREVMAAT